VLVQTILFRKRLRHMKRHISAILSAWLTVPVKSTNTLSFIRQRRTWISRAMTLVELVIVMAMVGTLAAIGVPAYNNYIEKVRVSQAIEDIRFIEAAIELYHTDNKTLPETLDLVELTARLDPWGNPYKYLKIEGKAKNEIKGKWRKDHFNVPVNSDFDLFSMGKDGKSKSPFTAKASRDDIVRANDGAYVGLVSEY
jgi:general secretion pathway protein G